MLPPTINNVFESYKKAMKRNLDLIVVLRSDFSAKLDRFINDLDSEQLDELKEFLENTEKELNNYAESLQCSGS